jgi:tripartite-type tricarboxylate transporter receptor subunit TctC
MPLTSSRRTVLLALAGAAAASASRADDYPSRPIKIIVPFGAGGPTDVYTRDIADEMRKALHQTVYMENRPGAGTTSAQTSSPRPTPTVTRC